jgi:DNA repair exonuclease SbcCD ATPase subunit
MQLLAASYDNIWPLVERPVLLNVLPGATLITAPIGTGKSFLFFDGPLFGLYKIQNRPVLNRLASRGSVRVVFVDSSESLWAVHRVIKRSPAGAESIQSHIFTLPRTKEAWYTFAHTQRWNEVLIPGGALEQLLLPHLEEHLCATQRETDQAILDLLPPKEVVMSLNFLVQEADSVFDLTPVERVQVFKHLFGLLGIDEAKETLLERRRQTQASLKVLSDQTARDTKARFHMKRIWEAVQGVSKVLWSFAGDAWKRISSYLAQPFLHDSTLLGDAVRIRGDMLTWYEPEQSKDLLTWIDIQKSLLLEQQGRQEVYEKQSKELTHRIQELQQRSNEIDKKRKTYGDATAQRDESTARTLQQQITDLQQQITQIDASFSLAPFMQTGETEMTWEMAKERVENNKQTGQLHKQQQLSLQDKLKEIDEQIHLLQTQYDKGQQQIDALSLDIEKSEKFYCNKIEGDCPYVTAIKWATVSTLRKQVVALQEQCVTLQERSTWLQARKTTILGELKELEEHIATLLTRFTNVPHKELMAHIATRQTLRTEMSRLEQTYMVMMQQQATAQQRLQERVGLDATFAELTSSLEALHAQQQELQAHLVPTTSLYALPQLEQTKQYIESIDVQYMLLDQLIGERNNSQTQVKKLEQQDIMLKQLADIFSKELLYVVLNDFLPQLESIINVFLAQMVEYTVHFYLPQASDEKMELAIEIHDEKGKRPVKSLSGGRNRYSSLLGLWRLPIFFKQNSSFWMKPWIVWMRILLHKWHRCCKMRL